MRSGVGYRPAESLRFKQWRFEQTRICHASLLPKPSQSPKPFLHRWLALPKKLSMILVLQSSGAFLASITSHIPSDMPHDANRWVGDDRYTGKRLVKTGALRTTRYAANQTLLLDFDDCRPHVEALLFHSSCSPSCIVEVRHSVENFNSAYVVAYIVGKVHPYYVSRHVFFLSWATRIFARDKINRLSSYLLWSILLSIQ